MNNLLIFDLDGVLVDACDWHRDAFLEAYRQVTGIIITNEEHTRLYNGLPTKVKLELLKAPIEQQEEISNIKQELTKELIQLYCNPNDELFDLLIGIRKNNILACYTNCIRETARLMLDITGYISLLDALVTNEDVVWPKPSPEGYNKLMDLYDCPTIIFEDSPKGIAAAKASGARVIEVKNNKDFIAKLRKI